MLSLGLAMMSRPKLLLLDEPSLGLAPALVVEIFNGVRRLADEDILGLCFGDFDLGLQPGRLHNLCQRGAGADALADLERLQIAHLLKIPAISNHC